MRTKLLLALVLLAFMTPGCGAIKDRLHRSTAPEPTPTPDTLVSHLGISTPFTKAVRGIAFRPYLPARQFLDVALVAPLNGDDVRENRGIAIEYVAGGQALVLSQWPMHGDIQLGQQQLGASPCTLIKIKATSVMWTTRSRLLMTLQPDGKIKPSRIFAEARRLLARGACS